jgi:hypothetical protein
VLPCLLAAWAAATAGSVPVEPGAPQFLGVPVALAGAVFMLAGIAALYVHGHGLPMNAYPPSQYVNRGIYRYFAHPIYMGFSLLVMGVAVAARSGSGFWLVAPVVMLGSTALVLGYERHDLRARFGLQVTPPRFHLAPDEESAPSGFERLSCYFLVLLPWVAIYEIIASLEVLKDAAPAYLPFEARLPVWAWTEPVYASTYLVASLAPLAARSRADLRRYELAGLLSMALVFPLFLAIPLAAPPRPFLPEGPLGAVLMWERSIDIPAEAFPSFHVIWALLSARVFAARTPRWRWLWRAWALAVVLCCVTTGMHAVVDVLAGFAMALLALRATGVWEAVRNAAERVAGSWCECRFGAVRLINHGLWGGASAFAAVFISGELAGSGHQAAILVAALVALVTSALWAQWIEGSPQLSRPFGYFGGVTGVALGALLAPLAGTSPWLVLACYSVAGPVAQSIGRLRCLVQGCCHGRPAPPGLGIRYAHPRSRVCRLTEWKGIPLHPTPLYSMAWNGFVGLAMLRLWSLAAPLSLIAGLYLILTGIGRFAEEAYRGEPQTPVFRGLRLYQWISAAAVLIGILLTSLPSVAAPAFQATWKPLWSALGFGMVAGIALGVDLPDSQRRFSRLA